MKSTRNRIVLVLIVVAIVVLAVYGRHHIHFDWRDFVEQLRMARRSRILLGLACIYIAYVVRGVRWAWLVRHTKRLPLFSLVGSQMIGFTAVALIGRVADLVRPYLVSRRTGLPLGSQIAVYVVERLFDAGSMALLTSSAILLAPAGAIPHPEILRKAGYWGLFLTIAGALFLVAVRLAGGTVASFAGRVLGAMSRGLGEAVEEKIRSFHAGLDTMRSFSDFGVVFSLSLGMWVLIAAGYLETTRAFVASPVLASMTAAKGVLLMIVSGGASIIQLPVLGWFTQIGLVEEAIRHFFGAGTEAALGCAATLLLVTFLGVVPVGLVWARFEGVSLIRIAEESEKAGEELVHPHAVPASSQEA